MGSVNGNSSRKAVVYVRVSSAEQEKEGFSIPAQLKLLQGYAASHGIKVVQEFIDVETAKHPWRRKLTGWLEECYFGRITTLPIARCAKHELKYAV